MTKHRTTKQRKSKTKKRKRQNIRLNHNKGSKSVPLLMKNQLSYTPFILLSQVYIAFHSTFPKIPDIQLLLFIFYTTLKLIPTWQSHTLQICERSYFMLKIVAKTPRISLYSSYTSGGKVMILEGFSDTSYLLFIFVPNFLNLTVLASRNCLRSLFSKFSIFKK